MGQQREKKQKNDVSDDRVIIFQYDQNTVSCLDAWQTGPRMAVLKKEKQKEKK